jgi:hypothetical protein
VTDAGISGPERRGYVVTHRQTASPQHKRQHLQELKWTLFGTYGKNLCNEHEKVKIYPHQQAVQQYTSPEKQEEP